MKELLKKPTAREFILLGIVAVTLLYAFWIKPHKLQGAGISSGSGQHSGKVEGANQAFSGNSPDEKGKVSERTAKPEKPVMEPNEARKRLKAAASISDLLEQEKAYRAIMAELCEAGHTEEAWATILPEAGRNRDVQIARFFFSASLDPQSFSAKLASLDDASEKKSALTSYLARSAEQYAEILESPEFKPVADELQKNDPNFLADVLGEAKRVKYDTSDDPAMKENIMGMIRDLHSKGLISNLDFAGMVARNIKKDPFELWSWVASSPMGIDDPSGFEGQLREGVVAGMVSKDAEGALARISADTGSSATRDLYTGLSRWASNNPKAANNWYLREGTKLNQLQQDSAARAFATVALELREMDGAEDWANRISDPATRDSILQKIHPPEKTGR
jgi:hypothetical protein